MVQRTLRNKHTSMHQHHPAIMKRHRRHRRPVCCLLCYPTASSCHIVLCATCSDGTTCVVPLTMHGTSGCDCSWAAATNGIHVMPRRPFVMVQYPFSQTRKPLKRETGYILRCICFKTNLSAAHYAAKGDVQNMKITPTSRGESFLDPV